MYGLLILVSKIKNKIYLEIIIYSYKFLFNYNIIIILINLFIFYLANFEWDKRECDNIPQYPRYGHTGIIYQKKFIVFGGKIKSITYHLMGDLEIYDLNDNTWSTPGFSSKNFIPQRRNHIAELIGHQLFIHGGSGENDEVLGDCHVLSLNPYKWMPAALNEITPAPFLTGHSSALVVPADLRYNPRMNIYKYPEMGFGKLYTNKVMKFYFLFIFKKYIYNFIIFYNILFNNIINKKL
jgi:hypothetical protein